MTGVVGWKQCVMCSSVAGAGADLRHRREQLMLGGWERAAMPSSPDPEVLS